MPAASSRWATEACADEGGTYSAVQKWWHGNQYGGFEICPGRTTDGAYLLVDARGVTNRIGWTKVENDHWVESAFLFEVPEAGTYTLGIQGMTRFAADLTRLIFMKHPA